MEGYEQEKAQPYIDIEDSYEFKLSLYKSDLFALVKSDQLLFWLSRDDYSPRQNKVEFNFIHKKKSNRKDGVITPSTISDVTKYNVDILGNTHKVTKENFKNYLQL